MGRIVERILSEAALRAAIVKACKEAGDPLTPQALHAWKKLKRGVPPGRVKIVAQVMELQPHEIRPDIFPRPNTSKKRE